MILPPHDLPRPRLGKYRLLRLLGVGGTSRVYLAEHLFLRRPVAVKLLTCNFARWPDFDLEMFEQTAAAAARLNHPNIVTIYDIDEERTRPFIVMEYVKGGSVHDLVLRRGPLPLEEALPIVAQVALALEHAHAENLVHCDIKPGNILLDGRGRVKVTDFGLARVLGPDRASLEGMIAGTPPYISPEQVQARRPDQRADIYSLGVSFFEMLTGRKPFPGSSDSSIFIKHLNETRDSVMRGISGASRAAVRVLRRMMARHPEDRYPSTRELLKDLVSLVHPDGHGGVPGRPAAAYRVRRKRRPVPFPAPPR